LDQRRLDFLGQLSVSHLLAVSCGEAKSIAFKTFSISRLIPTRQHDQVARLINSPTH
jgi:hypothetical protein